MYDALRAAAEKIASGEETETIWTFSVDTGEWAGIPASTHMWNVVRMEDGLNYLVDVTNGNKHEDLFLAPCINGNLEEGYYVHVVTEKIELNYWYITEKKENLPLW